MYTQMDIKEINGQRIMLEVDGVGTKTLDWVRSNSIRLKELVDREGILLIRGLKIYSSSQFAEALVEIFGEDLIDYSYRSTPRTELRGKVYTATEYHCSETIPQHNENSYSNKWPLYIGFFCLSPSLQGGCTPIADSGSVYSSIPERIRKKFEDKKILYVRNYGLIDLAWQEVFQTLDRNEVQNYCDTNGIEYEWLSDDRLRTRQVRQAIEKHPINGDLLWFNQAHLFHISSLKEDVQRSLLASLGPDYLPRNAFYGDYSEIETSSLQAIRDAYEKNKFSFNWEKGDLLLLDNMRFTHGREPFTGNRKVLVGMAGLGQSTFL